MMAHGNIGVVSTSLEFWKSKSITHLSIILSKMNDTAATYACLRTAHKAP